MRRRIITRCIQERTILGPIHPSKRGESHTSDSNENGKNKGERLPRLNSLSFVAYQESFPAAKEPGWPPGCRRTSEAESSVVAGEFHLYGISCQIAR
jgi:hypothetical protein